MLEVGERVGEKKLINAFFFYHLYMGITNITGITNPSELP